MADDELRRLERSTDPADAGRRAQALLRSGRTDDALDVAVQALLVSRDPSLRHLLPAARATVEESEDGTCSVPWSGLRSITAAKGLYLPGGFEHRGPSRLLDAGQGLVLVSYANGLAGLDVVRRTFVWTTSDPLEPLFATRDGVVASSGDALLLVDPLTGERRPYRAPVDRESSIARLDDALFVSVRSGSSTLFDPRTGEEHASVRLETPASKLVPDPTGFTLQLEGTVWSYDRAGQARWWNEDDFVILGACDGRLFLNGGGNTVAVSATTGEEAGELDAFSFDPILVTRRAVIVAGVELWAFDRVRLEPLWRLPVDPYLGFASTADAVLEYGPDGVRSLSADDGSELARVSLGTRRAGLMLPCAGRLLLPAVHRAGVIVVE